MRNFKLQKVYKYIWYQNSGNAYDVYVKLQKKIHHFEKQETKTPSTSARPRRPMRPSVNSWPRPWAKKSPRRPPCFHVPFFFAAFLFEVFSAAIVFFLKGTNGRIGTIVEPGDLERLWNIRKNNHPSSARKDIEWWIMINESIKWSMNLCKTLNVSIQMSSKSKPCRWGSNMVAVWHWITVATSVNQGVKRVLKGWQICEICGLACHFWIHLNP